MEQRAFVELLAFDQLEDEIRVAAYVLHPGDVGAQGPQAGQGKGTGCCLIATGADPGAALDALHRQTSRSLELSLTRAVVVGQAFAARGIDPVLDLIGRWPVPPVAMLFVSSADALAVLRAAPATEAGIPQYLGRFTEEARVPNPYSRPHTLQELQRFRLGTDGDLAVPLLEPTDVSLSGVALLKGGRLAGHLSPSESAWYYLLRYGLPGGEPPKVKIRKAPAAWVRLERWERHIHVTPRKGGVRAHIGVQVRVEPITPRQGVSPKMVEEGVRREVLNVLERLQEQGVDALGLRQALFRTAPNYSPSSWSSQFQDLPISVEVEAQVE